MLLPKRILLVAIVVSNAKCAISVLATDLARKPLPATTILRLHLVTNTQTHVATTTHRRQHVTTCRATGHCSHMLSSQIAILVTVVVQHVVRAVGVPRRDLALEPLRAPTTVQTLHLVADGEATTRRLATVGNSTSTTTTTSKCGQQIAIVTAAATDRSNVLLAYCFLLVAIVVRDSERAVGVLTAHRAWKPLPSPAIFHLHLGADPDGRVVCTRQAGRASGRAGHECGLGLLQRLNVLASQRRVYRTVVIPNIHRVVAANASDFPGTPPTHALHPGLHLLAH